MAAFQSAFSWRPVGWSHNTDTHLSAREYGMSDTDTQLRKDLPWEHGQLHHGSDLDLSHNVPFTGRAAEETGKQIVATR